MNIYCTFTDTLKQRDTVDSYYININDDEYFSHTFWRETKIFLAFPSYIALDLMYISYFVYAADRIVVRSDTYDAWTRNISLFIPVLEIDEWNKNKSLLEKMLKFLSGDNWTINFSSRKLSNSEIELEKKMESSSDTFKDINMISMFSGGLDSFIGVIDILSSSKNCAFISHYGGGKGVSEYQNLLRDKFVDHYSIEKNLFFGIYVVARNGIEDTMRTRSFMFFSIAICIASVFRRKISLIIPENGLISLNIPLTNSRAGSSSTRTTHPYYMKLFQELVLNMGLDIHFLNPYQFLTKGEMIRACKDKVFLQENINSTMSCSHPDLGRLQGESETCHCGYCLPCVIRRAAIYSSTIIDTTKYRDGNFKSGNIAEVNLNSYRIGMEKFDPKHAFLTIQKAGPIKADILKYTDLYIRGMKELKTFLESFDDT